ncbi:MAG: 1-deoxy-D-xylulose-5-phosphate reductoisomerase [Acidimicrobiia bacterium]
MGRHPLNPLVVLGASGSIGRQTLDVATRIGAPVVALAARTASDTLLAQADAHPDAIVCVVDPGERVDEFQSRLGDRFHVGQGAITEVAATKDSTVVNGVVGAAGLAASLSALYAGNRLALANKESLVAGGPLVRRALETGDGELIPVDSEHSAIWQCITGESPSSVARLVLTASGGPFRGFSQKQLAGVTVEAALDHPTWSMGPRITTDSATLMNKAFEVIEAHYLFDIPYDNIDVVVHPQSIVHSLVEFTDGVVKAEVGLPDMRKPIQYALTAPDRIEGDHPPLDLIGADLTFEAPDRIAFPCLDLGYAAGRAGGTATAVLNAADEVAVQAFLSGDIPFVAIPDVVGGVLDDHEVFEPETIEDVRGADRWSRDQARQSCERIRGG